MIEVLTLLYLAVAVAALGLDVMLFRWHRQDRARLAGDETRLGEAERKLSENVTSPQPGSRDHRIAEIEVWLAWHPEVVKAWESYEFTVADAADVWMDTGMAPWDV